MRQRKLTDKEKIKVLRRAIHTLKNHDDYDIGICDALALSELDFGYVWVIKPSYYGIRLPQRTYSPKGSDSLLFCYPLTKEGRSIRIEVLKKAIKKLNKKQP